MALLGRLDVGDRVGCRSADGIPLDTLSLCDHELAKVPLEVARPRSFLELGVERVLVGAIDIRLCHEVKGGHLDPLALGKFLDLSVCPRLLGSKLQRQKRKAQKRHIGSDSEAPHRTAPGTAGATQILQRPDPSGGDTGKAAGTASNRVR